MRTAKSVALTNCNNVSKFLRGGFWGLVSGYPKFTPPLFSVFSQKSSDRSINERAIFRPSSSSSSSRVEIQTKISPIWFCGKIPLPSIYAISDADTTIEPRTKTGKICCSDRHACLSFIVFEMLVLGTVNVVFLD